MQQLLHLLLHLLLLVEQLLHLQLLLLHLVVLAFLPVGQRLVELLLGLVILGGGTNEEVGSNPLQLFLSLLSYRLRRCRLHQFACSARTPRRPGCHALLVVVRLEVVVGLAWPNLVAHPGQGSPEASKCLPRSTGLHCCCNDRLNVGASGGLVHGGRGSPKMLTHLLGETGLLKKGFPWF